jgi:TRAP-type C4-dicarboxylate transport system substrate-binding protein
MLRVKFAAFFFVALFGSTALRAQTVLRIADSLPVGHFITQVITKPFIEQVEARTQGRIKLQYFPGEQLGKAKDLLMLTQNGVVDIGYVSPDYASDKMPLAAAFELPGLFSNYCQATAALWTTTHDGGYLQKSEFEPNRVIPVLTLMLPAYQALLSSSKPVAGLDDLKGLKLRSAGGAMDFTLRGLGIVPIKMTPPEVYESMSRGTIDGAIFPYMSAVSYQLQGLVKQGSVSRNFGTVVLTYSISENSFKRLPPDDQNLIMTIGKEISINACRRFEEIENRSLDTFKEKGMRLIEFSTADDQILERAFDNAAKDWAQALESRGKPGLRTLDAIKKAISDVR